MGGYIMNNLEKQQNQTESKRSRRSLSKFNKVVPQYESFWNKQYLSYPALDLHLKKKHPNYFISSKNGIKVETTKLIESFDSNQGFKVYKISVDTINAQMHRNKDTTQVCRLSNFSKDKATRRIPSTTHLIIFSLTEIPCQFPYQYLMNKEQSSPITKEATIQIAFSMYFESLNSCSAKEKAQTQLLLGLLVYQ